MGATRPLVIRRGSVQGAVVGVNMNTGSCGRIERSVVALIEVVFTGVLATHVVVVMAVVVIRRRRWWCGGSGGDGISLL